MIKLPEPLAPLAAYNQFINYKLVPKVNGKMDKIPINPVTGAACDAHDPVIQVTFEQASATGQPVAFVFTEKDPFFFLDIDNCSAPGGWNTFALQLCATFRGCAVEISQSGTGLHIFGISGAELTHGCKNISMNIEFYTSKRFVALTGNGAIGNAAHTMSPGTYSGFIDQYFPPAPISGPSAEWTDAPDPTWSGPEDDKELITRMLKAKSAKGIMGYSATIKQLWEADEEALSRAFPDSAGNQMRAFDWSSADAALCSHLAFWTGKNCERMALIFEQSALVRDKWTDREDYRNNTILHAVGRCQNVYRQKRPPVDETPVPGIRQGLQILTVQGQLELFRGCCYIQDIHRIFDPEGYLLKPEQFRAKYGGYVFCIDSLGDKTTRNAWEVFTESQAYSFPRAHTTCFRPELKSGEVLNYEGLLLLNTYVPVLTSARDGDPSPFLDLLRTMLPDTQDRSILLAYMAACVQHVGVKFQWAPLIQGVEGNGKSFLGACVAHAIGEKYTHIPDPKDLGNVFNSWIQNKLLIIIEEVYIKNKTDIIETLKWMVTNARVPIQAKGQDQITGDNRANFIMLSNHRDGVRKTERDRRTAVFYTAQQEYSDIVAHGMDGEYFPKLYAWANSTGFAIINKYLREYKIPDELNPASACHRAPVTSSTQDAIAYGRSAIEQDILEATESGSTGFNGGWISSIAFGKLLDLKHIKISINKRREVLKSLGYIPHPALYGGRVNNRITVEQGKPVLYIKIGHITQNISDAAMVAKKYQEAQGYAAPGTAQLPDATNVI